MAPLMILSEFEGIDIEKAYYDIACRYLLKNQPHDSICGCSIDKVHKDMLYRYSQVKSITEVVTKYFNDSLSENANDGNPLKLTIMNFDFHKKNNPIIAKIEFPSDWDCVYNNKSYYQKINMFTIVDDDENVIPYQILKIDRNVAKYKMQEESFVDVYTVAFTAELNSFGATDFSILPADKPAIYPKKYSDIKLGAENRYLSFEINIDGSLNVVDKNTGKTYRNVNTFTDDGDCGNGWFYTKTDFGEGVINSCGSPCTIEVINQGPIFYSYRITKSVIVPKTTNYDDYRRSDDTVELKIVTEVSLNGDDKKILFNTTVSNNAKNHRLRVHFPSEISGKTYKASQSFCFVERNRGVSERGIVSFEPEAYEKNTGGIVSVGNKECNFSFIGINGIHEAGVSEDGTISVTLFRSVGRMFHETNPSFCQLQGDMSFEYALTFEDNDTALIQMQKDMANTTYCITSNNISRKVSSLFEVDDSDVILSIIKPSIDKNKIVIRIYNPSDSTLNTKIKFGFDFNNVYEAYMSEEKICDYCVENNEFDVLLKAYEIKTFVITL